MSTMSNKHSHSETANMLYKQAAALRAQADLLEKRAAGGALMPIGRALVKTAPQVGKRVPWGKILAALGLTAGGTATVAATAKATADAEERRDAEERALTRYQAADAKKMQKTTPDDSSTSNLITGGATAAGGVIGGILGNTLAPEKYKKLMTAIGALTGAAVSGAGAHYGQKALNA